MSTYNIRVVSNITKEYTDMYKIKIYKEPVYFVRKDTVKRRREQVDVDYRPAFSSVQRTKATVKDIILCNDFDYFCTFTFDPKKVNSFSFGSVWRVMHGWLHHQSDRSASQGVKFKYLIIPEKHKSGRYHFHALIKGYIGSMRPSGCVTSTCKPIYNLTSFRSGFTTAVAIDDSEGVAHYVSKYITKSLCNEFNQRRFFCSRYLLRPTKTVNSTIFSKSLPIFRRHISQNQFCDDFIIDKNSLLEDNDAIVMSHNAYNTTLKERI